MADHPTQTDTDSPRARWEARAAEQKERKAKFVTLSDIPVKPLYDGSDLAGFDVARDLGFPGEYPFTRGPYDTMYRGQLWTMRQFAGFGTAKDTNERYKFLLSKGQTGLSVAFDMPTLMGRDSDHELALGEVGREGVAVASLEDVDTLFSGIDLGKVSTSMTINGPAAVLLAMYVASAELRGVPRAKLRGTIQTDILKEYQAQKEYIYPPKPSMRIITDMMRFCADEMPYWHALSISGYHIREAGSTAVQDLAFTLANGFAYVEAGIALGMDVDAFAPRLSFFFNAHMNFFEEIAKYRAARRIWARKLKEKYGAKDDRSLRLRFHTQTAGVSLTAQQPENNIVRTAFEALAAVLGGTQSLHTNSFDEALALPTEKAVKVALRTQQILAHETGVTDTIDPLAGSYFVESLTNRMEEEAEKYFVRIEELGGAVAAIECGFFQREIARSAYQFQKEVEAKQRIIVGVNEYVEPAQEKIELLKIDARVEQEQVASLQGLRARRDGKATERALAGVRQASRDGSNLMRPLIEAVKAHATLGEICDVWRQEFGTWQEPPNYW